MIYSMNRKKHQRLVNKMVRSLNKAIEKDDLWRGRFICRQKEAYFLKYEDKSGAILSVFLEFYDKKTGITKEFHTTSASLSFSFGKSELFWKMNSFITETVRVWHNENPYEDKTDYREIKI